MRTVDKKALGERVALRRSKLGMSQAALADTVGMKQQGIVSIEAGDVARPRLLREIAAALKTTDQWLLWQEGPEESAPAIETNAPADAPGGYRPPPQFLGERDLPVYAAAEGGPGQMVVSTDAIEHVPRPWYLGNVKDGFAVLVVGDSMEPAFEAGDMAVVNPRLAPQRDKDVILVKGELEGDFIATVKRLLSWNDREWKLRQFNPRKDFTLPRKEWPRALRVVGKFVGG